MSASNVHNRRMAGEGEKQTTGLVLLRLGAIFLLGAGSLIPEEQQPRMGRGRQTKDESCSPSSR